MEKKRLILLILSILMIIIPFFINIYTIYKLICVALGIILFEIFLATSKKLNLFLTIYLPILLLVFTYSIDYLKTYTLEVSPIFILENKINNDVSVYNSLFYRIYKCQNNYIFDNDYKMNFVCNTSLVENIDINTLLSEPREAYKKYKHDFIKVTGKVSKIIGNSKIELKEYTMADNSLNGYVKFNDNSKLIVNVNDTSIQNYKIYDYITVVGLLNSYNKKSEELTLINTKIEENNLYDNYSFEVIESNDCDHNLKDYIDNYYTLCLDNIYLNYGIDNYELSYALKDKKITFDSITKDSEIETNNGHTYYSLPKFNILSCQNGKNIFQNKKLEKDYTLCEE